MAVIENKVKRQLVEEIQGFELKEKRVCVGTPQER